jgi:hypothetical protein
VGWPDCRRRASLVGARSHGGKRPLKGRARWGAIWGIAEGVIAGITPLALGGLVKDPRLPCADRVVWRRGEIVEVCRPGGALAPILAGRDKNDRIVQEQQGTAGAELRAKPPRSSPAARADEAGAGDEPDRLTPLAFAFAFAFAFALSLLPFSFLLPAFFQHQVSVEKKPGRPACAQHANHRPLGWHSEICSRGEKQQ